MVVTALKELPGALTRVTVVELPPGRVVVTVVLYVVVATAPAPTAVAGAAVVVTSWAVVAFFFFNWHLIFPHASVAFQ